MSALLEPPRRVTPETFYSDYAPRAWSTFFGGLNLPPFALAVGCHVDKVSYGLAIDGASLTATPGAPDRPLVEFICSLDAWCVAMHDIWPRYVKQAQPHVDAARRRLPGLLASRPPQERLDLLAGLPGTLEVDYTDDAGDLSQYVVRIAGGNVPGGRIVVSEEDLWKLLRSRGKVSQLLQARARLEGDVGWLLRVARLLEPDPRSRSA